MEFDSSCPPKVKGSNRDHEFEEANAIKSNVTRPCYSIVHTTDGKSHDMVSSVMSQMLKL
jgi:hypothetical protein